MFPFHRAQLTCALRFLAPVVSPLFVRFSVHFHKYEEYKMPVGEKTSYACWCNQNTSEKSQKVLWDYLESEAQRNHEDAERWTEEEKEEENRRVKKEEVENKWHSTLRTTLATWLFQNESNARPRNEKKKREKNQYSAIKHKARLCGAEGNLLFIKLTPLPPSLRKHITPFSL